MRIDPVGQETEYERLISDEDTPKREQMQCYRWRSNVRTSTYSSMIVLSPVLMTYGTSSGKQACFSA